MPTPNTISGDRANALHPSFTGRSYTDPDTYMSSAPSRIDAKYGLIPLMNEILAHQYDLRNIDASWITTGTLGLSRLSGITTTELSSSAGITVSQGGTGVATFGSNGILYGNGTSAVQVLTGPTSNCPRIVYYPTNSAAPSTLDKGTALQVLRMNAAANGIEWATGASTVDIQYFAASGTWTRPSGAATNGMTYVLVINSGGGGGSGRRGATSTNRKGGRGGASGTVCDRWFMSSQLSSTETVTIGASVAGGTSVSTDDSNGFNGSAGNMTCFGGSTLNNAKLTMGDSMFFSGTGGSTSSITIVQGALLGSTSFWLPYPFTQGGADGGQGRGQPFGPGSGGGGGAIDNTNTIFVGGKGGHTNKSYGASSTISAGTNGGAGGSSGTGSNGATATPASSWIWFGSGGGGGGTDGTVGYAGGDGGAPGGGGGGGGASLNGNVSGAGGAGAAGGCLVITIY